MMNCKEEQILCKNIKREYEENNTYRENSDPLALQDPIGIGFEILKKEEKDVKREDPPLSETDTAGLPHSCTDDGYENAENTKFTDLIVNTRSKQKVKKNISSHEKKENYETKYACGECNERYFGFRLLHKHINDVHLLPSNCDETSSAHYHTDAIVKEENKYECQVCQKKFTYLVNLKQHSIVHTRREKMLKDFEQQSLCAIQHEEKQNYESTSEVTREKLNLYQGDKKYICSICDRSYTEYRNLKSHIEAIHLELSHYKCAQCNKTYSTIKSLTKHTSTVHGQKKYECTVCYTKFTNLTYLQMHTLLHTTKKKYECDNCTQKFHFLHHLRYHIKCRCLTSLHKKSKVKKNICDSCEMEFTTFHSLAAHMDKVHLRIIGYKCEQCNITFMKPSHLKKHTNTDTHKNYNKIECDYCNKKFSHPSLLKQHMSVHSKTKKYVCDDCDKRYFTYSSLKLHISTSHIKSKDYQCEHCGKAFVQKGSLDNHINVVHKKLRKYECQVCYKKFQASHHLQNHIICVHERVKNFVCEQCGDKFLLAHHLRNHVKFVHKGIAR